MSLISLAAISCLSVPASPFNLLARSRDGQSPHTSGELLQQARQLTDIRSGDVPSFRLTARIETFDEKGTKREGTFTLLWNSPTMWREEIAFPGSSQVRLARINKLLISRNPSTPSEEVYSVVNLMAFPSLLQMNVRDQLQKLRETTKDGSRERRVDITIGSQLWKKVYFDGSALVPNRIEYKGAADGMRNAYSNFRTPAPAVFDVEFQFGDYMEFHGLQFPRTLRRLDSHVLKVQVQVQEWIAATYGESDFVPPDDSHWIRWCPQMEPPRLRTQLIMINPVFPPQLRTGGPPSRVVIYGIIGTDGEWHNVEPVKSAGAMVDSFWMGLMRKQRFTPAQCGETPVESETMIEFDYR